MSLRDARQRRDEAKQLLARDVDPSAHRKASRRQREERAGSSFEAVAREWYAKHVRTWAPAHGERIIRRLERDIFPWLGSRPIGEITAPELLAVLRRIEARGALETAHRALQNCGQVFHYAVATGRAERNPGADLRGALPPVKPEHFASITEPQAVGALLRALDSYAGGPVVRAALRLAPLVFVRPVEFRTMRWADVDFEAAEWRFTTSKTATAHIVPLATHTLAVLREVEPLTGHSAHVFPSARGAARPMSENAVTVALRALGYTGDRFTGHGFRAMARTLLDEQLGFPAHLIEHQLGHAVRDPMGRAYNRTSHLPDRRAMMQRWADYLDTLRTGGNVVPLRNTTAQRPE